MWTGQTGQDRTGQVIVMKWKSSSISGWEAVFKVGCGALPCTPRVKIVCVSQERGFVCVKPA